MRTNKARRVRAAVHAHNWTSRFILLPTHAKVRKLHRDKLSVTGMMAYDILEKRYKKRSTQYVIKRTQELMQESTFLDIIQRNYPEPPK